MSKSFLCALLPLLSASAELTCGDVKEHYKNAECCGKPSTVIDTLAAVHHSEHEKTILDDIADFKPFDITPCNPLEADCLHQCGNVKGFECDAKGWVFCQNAVCDETPVKNGTMWVSKCHCWQQPDGETTKSLIPVAANSGANCVLDMGPGGADMCTAMQNGALWSTFGVGNPTYLPGKPLQAASCPPHSLWAWCWGAPCEMVDGQIICSCPIMKSMNSAAQAISLAGEAQCPPNIEDPCTKGWTHNSMPAGTSPSEYMDTPTCYDYAACAK